MYIYIESKETVSYSNSELPDSLIWSYWPAVCQTKQGYVTMLCLPVNKMIIESSSWSEVNIIKGLDLEGPAYIEVAEYAGTSWEEGNCLAVTDISDDKIFFYFHNQWKKIIILCY